MSHTVGPWAAADAEWIMSQRTGMGFRYFPVRGAGQTWDICNVFADEDDDEMLANVRLVSVAPELLEACKEMAGILHAMVKGGADPYLDVIRRAEGRSDA